MKSEIVKRGNQFCYLLGALNTFRLPISAQFAVPMNSKLMMTHSPKVNSKSIDYFKKSNQYTIQKLKNEYFFQDDIKAISSDLNQVRN